METLTITATLTGQSNATVTLSYSTADLQRMYDAWKGRPMAPRPAATREKQSQETFADYIKWVGERVAQDLSSGVVTYEKQIAKPPTPPAITVE